MQEVQFHKNPFLHDTELAKNHELTPPFQELTSITHFRPMRHERHHVSECPTIALRERHANTSNQTSAVDSKWLETSFFSELYRFLNAQHDAGIYSNELQGGRTECARELTQKTSELQLPRVISRRRESWGTSKSDPYLRSDRGDIDRGVIERGDVRSCEMVNSIEETLPSLSVDNLGSVVTVTASPPLTVARRPFKGFVLGTYPGTRNPVGQRRGPKGNSVA